MKPEIKKFIEKSFNEGKDREFLEEKLAGVLSNIELNLALNYFDKLSKKRKENIFISIIKFPILIIKIIFLTLKVKSLEIKNSIKKTLKKDNVRIKKKNKFIEHLRKRISKKSKKEKIILFSSAILIILLLILVAFSNLIYSKKCETQECFVEMVANCNRANYQTDEIVTLKSEIIGLTKNGCEVKIAARESAFEIKKDSEMTCLVPYGKKVNPSSELTLCSGKLREEIQDTIISELYKNLGQN